MRDVLSQEMCDTTKNNPIQNAIKYISSSRAPNRLTLLVMMRKIHMKDEIELTDEVEIIHEKRVTTFGTSAKIDAPRKYRGWRANVVIVRE